MTRERVAVVWVAPETSGDAATALPDDFDVTRVRSASDALAHLDDHAVDAVVSANDLPDGTGVDLLAVVRHRDDRLPFVLCAADGSEQVAADAVDRGVTAYRPGAPEDVPRDELAARLRAAVADARERRASRRDSARLESLLANATDAVVTVDDDGVIRDVNDAVEQVLGYAPGALVGEPLTALVAPDRVDDHVDAFETYVRTGERTVDWTDLQLAAQHADGHTVPVSVSFAEFTVHGDRYFTGVLRDVTDRVEARRELERQNERLDEFASVVSHDLRNPLSVARGNLDLLAADVDDPRVETARDALARMDELVEDVLTLARQGDLVGDPDSVSLPDLADAAWAATSAPDATLTVTDVPGTVAADERALRQLLANLFRNAVEHADPGVTVTLGGLPDGFFVADDGPGIPPEDRERVLEPGVTTSSDGTGFGLAIVTRVASAHGWDVAVTASESGGARFEVTGVETA